MLVLRRHAGESVVLNFFGMVAVVRVIDRERGQVLLGITAGSDARRERPPRLQLAVKEAGGSMRRHGIVPDLVSGDPSPEAVDSRSRTAGQPLEV